MKNKINIGMFEISISEHNPDKIWIYKTENGEGEGGEFDLKEVEGLIKKYYDDNF